MGGFQDLDASAVPAPRASPLRLAAFVLVAAIVLAAAFRLI
jgi:hypothetical protein